MNKDLENIYMKLDKIKKDVELLVETRGDVSHLAVKFHIWIAFIMTMAIIYFR